MTVMETFTLNEDDPPPFIAKQIEAIREGDNVALSFLPEGDTSRPVRIALAFDDAVKLSAQIRRAIGRQGNER